MCTSPFCLQHNCLEEQRIPCCPLSFLCLGPAILACHRVLRTEADRCFATKNRSKGGMNLVGMCRQSPGPRNASQERSIPSVLFPPLVLSKEGRYGQTQYQKREEWAVYATTVRLLLFRPLQVNTMTADLWLSGSPRHLCAPTIKATQSLHSVRPGRDSLYFWCTGIFSTSNEFILCCMSGCVWAFCSTGWKIMSFSEGHL